MIDWIWTIVVIVVFYIAFRTRWVEVPDTEFGQILFLLAICLVVSIKDVLNHGEVSYLINNFKDSIKPLLLLYMSTFVGIFIAYAVDRTKLLNISIKRKRKNR